MSDYTSTYTKGTGDTVEAADFSTEFDAIAAASTTKYDDSTGTLTATTINELGTINDTNGNELLQFGVVGSAVTQIKITNAATGNKPIISAEGQANRGIELHDSNGNQILTLSGVASAANQVDISNSASGSDLVISADGVTNVALDIQSKGSSNVKANGGQLTYGGNAYGGLVFIQGQTASSDNTIDFSAGIDSTFQSYMLELVSVKPATNAEVLNIRVQSASSWQAGAQYDYTNAGSAAAVSSSNQSELAITEAISSTASNGGVSGRIWLYDPETTSTHTRIHADTGYFTSAGAFGVMQTAGRWDQTGAVTGIRIFFDAGGAGHEVASGFFRLYGVLGAVS